MRKRLRILVAHLTASCKTVDLSTDFHFRFMGVSTMPRVVHFEIHAENPERAIAFYQSLFG